MASAGSQVDELSLAFNIDNPVLTALLKPTSKQNLPRNFFPTVPSTVTQVTQTGFKVGLSRAYL